MSLWSIASTICNCVWTSTVWHRETLKDIMKACIILHNMIVEDERHVRKFDFNYEEFDVILNILVSHEHTTDLMEFIQQLHHIRDRDIHSQLQHDLIEHIWQIHETDNL